MSTNRFSTTFQTADGVSEILLGFLSATDANALRATAKQEKEIADDQLRLSPPDWKKELSITHPKAYQSALYEEKHLPHYCTPFHWKEALERTKTERKFSEQSTLKIWPIDRIQDPFKSFFKAILTGNLAEVESLYQSNRELVSAVETDDYYTVFLKAIDLGHLPVVQRLVEIKPSLLHFRSNNVSPLAVAIKTNDVRMIQFLLSNRHIHVNKPSDTRKAELGLAAARGNLAINHLLLKVEGINANSRFLDDDILTTVLLTTPLIIAAREGHVKVVNLFLAQPRIHINQQDDAYGTALIAAIRAGHIDVVKQLLKNKNINVNKSAKVYDIGRNTSPLIAAVNSGNIEIIELLLQRKDIRINEVVSYDGYEETALSAAVKNHNPQIVKLLLDHKDIQVDKTTKQTSKVDKVTKHLIPIGRCTPLQIAACYAENTNDHEIIKKLLAKGADPNYSHNNSNHNTALHFAARERNDQVIEILNHHHKIDINRLNNNGQTAFQRRLSAGYAPIPGDAKRGNDFTPLDKYNISMDFNNQELYHYLVSRKSGKTYYGGPFGIFSTFDKTSKLNGGQALLSLAIEAKKNNQVLSVDAIEQCAKNHPALRDGKLGKIFNKIKNAAKEAPNIPVVRSSVVMGG